MLAMQYSIELPVGYEPERIHARVRERSALFTGLPGLVHKSYLFSPADALYAPFYIWSDIMAARTFLFDDLFKGVVKSFCRPRVRTWMVLDSAYANRQINPTFALRETDTIAPEDNLETLFGREKQAQQELLAHADLHFHALALDAERWEIIRYSLWRNEACAAAPSADCVQSYEVVQYQNG